MQGLGRHCIEPIVDLSESYWPVILYHDNHHLRFIRFFFSFRHFDVRRWFSDEKPLFLCRGPGYLLFLLASSTAA